MNNIDVTRNGQEGAGAGDEVPLEESAQVAHDRIVSTIRWLLAHTDVTQQDLARLLEFQESTMSRCLIEHGAPGRRRDWRAPEVFRLALFFDLPVEVFFGTNVEAEWERRMRAARRDHRALLRALDEEDD